MSQERRGGGRKRDWRWQRIDVAGEERRRKKEVRQGAAAHGNGNGGGGGGYFPMNFTVHM
ncbi:hypothetical protein HanXRQr2_Chr11g0475421 [Helianthus annuus]|uniref:Uncharacterized protein n=1 Tax=Helianthus annuus TaxID=4232 RepID=A0A9K3HLN7_HELAN|nr:hypothetical protein HanXRQr2_Chr11g0475421 [Helianthus annuus]